MVCSRLTTIYSYNIPACFPIFFYLRRTPLSDTRFNKTTYVKPYAFVSSL